MGEGWSYGWRCAGKLDAQVASNLYEGFEVSILVPSPNTTKKGTTMETIGMVPAGPDRDRSRSLGPQSWTRDPES